MRKWICSALLTCVCVSAPERGIAQGRTYSQLETAFAEEGGGGGGIFDWIHKLSGPEFVGPALALFYDLGGKFPGEPGPRLRFKVSQRWSIDRAPQDTTITMTSFQGTLELPIVNYPLYTGLGFAVHRFSGDGFETVTNWSVPVLLGLRLRTPWVVGPVYVSPIVETALHYFAKFDADDFAGVSINVSRDDSEAVLQFSLGFDIRPAR